jgi:hypothetical protein
LAAIGDSNDFADSNEFKDEAMRGLIVPHLPKKFRSKLLPNWERAFRPFTQLCPKNKSHHG